MILYDVDKENRRVSARFVCRYDFNKWGARRQKFWHPDLQAQSWEKWSDMIWKHLCHVTHVDEPFKTGDSKGLYETIQFVLNGRFDAAAFVATVKCAPEDEFSIAEGKKLASQKLLDRFHRALSKAEIYLMGYYELEIDKLKDKNQRLRLSYCKRRFGK